MAASTASWTMLFGSAAIVLRPTPSWSSRYVPAHTAFLSRRHHPSLSLLHLRQRHLGLRQPERHVHGTIRRDGSGQLRTGLLPLACPGIQRAEAAVAVGHEWAHAEFLGQGESLSVVMFG